MPISKKQRNSSRAKSLARKQMKDKTTMAKSTQAQDRRLSEARATYTPPKPKKQPAWRSRTAD